MTTNQHLSARAGSAVMLLNLLCVMLATGVPTCDGLVLAAYCAVVTAGGAGIYSWTIGRRKLTLTEAVGAGFATGTALPALTIFLIGEGGYRDTSMTWLWLVGLVIAAIVSMTRTPLRLEVEHISFTPLALIPILTVVGYHAWSPLLWPYLFGFIIIIAARFVLRFVIQSGSYAKLDFDLTTLLLAPIVGLSLQILAQHLFEFRRPYLYLGWLTDNMYDESLSWSVARYGHAENPFFVGHRIVGYLLTNSWSGTITNALDVGPFTVISSFGVLASLIACFLMILAISEEHGHKPRIAMIAICLAALQGSFGEVFPLTEPPRIQHFLTLCWFFLAILLIERMVSRISIPLVVFLFFVGIAVLLGKTQMFLLLLVFLGVSACVMLATRRHTKFFIACFLNIFMLSAVFLWANNFFLKGGSNPWTFSLDLETLTLWIVPITITLVSRTTVPFIFSTFRSSGNDFVLRVGLTSILVCAAFALLRDANGLRHMVLVSLILGAISAAPIVYRVFEFAPRWQSVVLVCIGASLGSLLSAVREFTLSRSYSQDSPLRILTVSHPELAFLATMSGVLLVLVLIPRLTRLRGTGNLNNRISIFSIVILLVLGANFGLSVAWSTRTEIRGLIAVLDGREWPSSGVREEPHLKSMKWIRDNTDQSSILASNLLCRGLPPANEYHISRTDADCGFRNVASIVASWSERRSYLEAVSYAQVSKSDEMTAHQRYRDSILFATNNDPDSYLRMIRDGVDYFVVDLGQTPLRDWEPHGSIRYADEHYAILELNN